MKEKPLKGQIKKNRIIFGGKTRLNRSHKKIIYYMEKRNYTDKWVRKSILLATLFFLIPGSIYPNVMSLSDSAQISVIIEGPSNKNIVYMNGHVSLRINDPGIDVDYIFSYGAFTSQSQVYLALIGKQVSELWAMPSEQAIQEDIKRKNTRITEHILNFTCEEKERLWQDLMFNALPENRAYEYDILRRSCATLPVELIEKNAAGEVVYNFPPDAERVSFREATETAYGPFPWICFFRDIIFNGDKHNSKKISKRDEFFLPLKVEAGFLAADIVDKEGMSRPLILSSHTIHEGVEDPPAKNHITPLQLAFVLLTFTIILSLIEWWRRKQYRVYDCLLFGIAGLMGTALFLLVIFSNYQYTSTNFCMFWLHPVHIFGVVLFAFRKFDKPAYYYHILNILLMTFIISGKFFLPRYYNDAFLPLMFCLWIRSLAGIVRYRMNNLKNKSV